MDPCFDNDLFKTSVETAEDCRLTALKLIESLQNEQWLRLALAPFYSLSAITSLFLHLVAY